VIRLADGLLIASGTRLVEVIVLVWLAIFVRVYLDRLLKNSKFTSSESDHAAVWSSRAVDADST